MPEEPEKRECDPNDLLCQMEILGHLKGMKVALGDEQFGSRFPELEGLDGKLAERIKEQGASLKEALEKCGLLPVTEPEATTIIEE